MSPQAILPQIDRTIEQLGDHFELPPHIRARSRSLAFAGALAALTDLTPRELLEALAPAVQALQARDALQLDQELGDRL